MFMILITGNVIWNKFIFNSVLNIKEEEENEKKKISFKYYDD